MSFSLSNSHKPASVVCLVRRPLPFGTSPLRPRVFHVSCQYRIANHLYSPQNFVFFQSVLVPLRPMCPFQALRCLTFFFFLICFLQKQGIVRLIN